MTVKVRPALRDAQDEPHRGYCRICGGELYSRDPWPLCEECKEKQNGRDD